MGYTTEQVIQVNARLERHNGPGDLRDNEAAERLRQEIIDLIQSDPDYERIVPEYRR